MKTLMMILCLCMCEMGCVDKDSVGVQDLDSGIKVCIGYCMVLHQITIQGMPCLVHVGADTAVLSCDWTQFKAPIKIEMI